MVPGVLTQTHIEQKHHQQLGQHIRQNKIRHFEKSFSLQILNKRLLWRVVLIITPLYKCELYRNNSTIHHSCSALLQRCSSILCRDYFHDKIHYNFYLICTISLAFKGSSWSHKMFLGEFVVLYRKKLNDLQEKELILKTVYFLL
jgi:hypothetical protein